MRDLWKALLSFCTAERIRVVLNPLPSSTGLPASFSPVKPWWITIYDSEGKTEEELIYLLAAEIGHVIDAKNTAYDSRYELAKMLCAEGEYLSMDLRRVLLEREKAATAYGRSLLVCSGLVDISGYDQTVVDTIFFYTQRFRENNKHTQLLERIG